MSFKKLHPLLKEALNNAGFEDSNPLQKKILPILKGGSDAYVIAPTQSGKTTALIINTIHKLKAEAFEDSPRALILVETKQIALDLKEKFTPFIRHTDLRVYTVYDAHDIEKQRDEIYVGTDILIATPARLSKLYFRNWVHLGQIKLFAVEDADFISRNNIHNIILRLTESVDKCQFVIISDTMSSKMANYKNSFMNNARILKED
jgi:superfamily II DNA/RNA helicase